MTPQRRVTAVDPWTPTGTTYTKECGHHGTIAPHFDASRMVGTVRACYDCEAPADDATSSHPDHDGLRAQHLDGWTCRLCGVPQDGAQDYCHEARPGLDLEPDETADDGTIDPTTESPWDEPTDAELMARFESLGDPIDPADVPAAIRAGREVWSYGYDADDPELFTTLDASDLWAWEPLADRAAVVESWAPFRVSDDRPLTQDECDALGLDGRDGTGTYRLSDLTADQRDELR